MTQSDAYAALAALGVFLPEILVPAEGIDISSWAVIACDQYTSEPEYWRSVADWVGNKPSTLHCILPELLLESAGAEEAINGIKKTMAAYLKTGIVRSLPPGLILTERATPFHPSRRGMVLALDMERYDYKPGAESLIRPTEGTILERIPPRVKIRREAALELPHIMVLIDDPQNSVIDGLFRAAASEPPLYEGDLMLGSGHIRGYFLAAEKAAPVLAESLSSLRERGGKGNFLFAVGDGNHSLATAKAVWEEKKALLPPEARTGHPARYALAEIVNLYDPGIEFRPIHRILTGIPAADFFAFIRRKPGFSLEKKASFAETEAACAPPPAFQPVHPGSRSPVYHAGILSRNGQAVLSFAKDGSFLPTGIIQDILGQFLREHPGKIDYIHGRDSLFALSARENSAGILLPALLKEELFPAVIRGGVLPRKAFSLGEAPEKRFYLEARKVNT
jgi:hypothetical protein